MTLATKNGSLIVQDGKIAENCGCCGGWYCCASSACLRDQIRNIAVTISAPDYFYTEPSGFAIGVRGSSISGTYAITNGSGNYFALQFPSPHLHEIGVTFMPPSPCCENVPWVLYIGFCVHTSSSGGLGGSAVTPEQLWQTPCSIGGSQPLSGTLASCLSPVSSSASGSFNFFNASAMFPNGAPATVSISIT